MTSMLRPKFLIDYAASLSANAKTFITVPPLHALLADLDNYSTLYDQPSTNRLAQQMCKYYDDFFEKLEGNMFSFVRTIKTRDHDASICRYLCIEKVDQAKEILQQQLILLPGSFGDLILPNNQHLEWKIVAAPFQGDVFNAVLSLEHKLSNLKHMQEYSGHDVQQTVHHVP